MNHHLGKTTVDKPFAPSCERNREPILEVLREHFADRRDVLEIGSGTGQHAVYFAAALPRLTWQTSERAENLPGLRRWLDDAELPNTPPPLMLDVAGDAWPVSRYDAVFTANTLHIMHWTDVEALFGQLGDVLRDDARLAIYGPFNFNGQYSSASNAAFDTWLRQRDALSCIRDFEAVDRLAARLGFHLIDQRPMPAHNFCLVWQRGGDF
jgi:SAM-dependent methyltransferase